MIEALSIILFSNTQIIQLSISTVYHHHIMGDRQAQRGPGRLRACPEKAKTDGSPPRRPSRSSLLPSSANIAAANQSEVSSSTTFDIDMPSFTAAGEPQYSGYFVLTPQTSSDISPTSTPPLERERRLPNHSVNRNDSSGRPISHPSNPDDSTSRRKGTYQKPLNLMIDLPGVIRRPEKIIPRKAPYDSRSPERMAHALPVLGAQQRSENEDTNSYVNVSSSDQNSEICVGCDRINLAAPPRCFPCWMKRNASGPSAVSDSENHTRVDMKVAGLNTMNDLELALERANGDTVNTVDNSEKLA